MNPCTFPEANATFLPPDGLDETQVIPIPAYRGIVEYGNLDGSVVVVTVWMPTEKELAALVAGGPVYLSFIGGLPPHFACTDFKTAAFQED